MHPYWFSNYPHYTLGYIDTLNAIMQIMCVCDGVGKVGGG